MSREDEVTISREGYTCKLVLTRRSRSHTPRIESLGVPFLVREE